MKNYRTRLARLRGALPPMPEPPAAEDLEDAIEFERMFNAVYDIEETDGEIIERLEDAWRERVAGCLFFKLRPPSFGETLRLRNGKFRTALRMIYGIGADAVEAPVAIADADAADTAREDARRNMAEAGMVEVEVEPDPEPRARLDIAQINSADGYEISGRRLVGRWIE